MSIPTYIAEGNARNSTKDYLRFLSMAAGSLAETETQLLLAERFGYVQTGGIETLLNDLRSVSKQLQSLKNALKSRIVADNSPFPVPRSPFPA